MKLVLEIGYLVLTCSGDINNNGTIIKKYISSLNKEYLGNDKSK